MDERIMQISEYDGPGYRPLIDSAGWRVAILRWDPSMLPEKMECMERHTHTEEVFVLLNGLATLILGGNEPQANDIFLQDMDQGKLYNVKRNAWHSILTSRDATILIVENRDTGEVNTEYSHLSESQKQEILSSRQKYSSSR